MTDRDPSRIPERETRAILPDAEAWFGLWIGRFTSALAVLGGVVLTLVMAVAVLSIIGRYLRRSGLEIFSGLGPIPGDFEIVAMGSGFAIFCFLAWCQFNRGHVTVDIFVSWTGQRAMAWLSMVMNLILTVAVVVLAQQHYGGLLDRIRFGETTLILQIPVKYGYWGGLVGLWSFAVVSAYTTWRSLNEALEAGEPGDTLP